LIEKLLTIKYTMENGLFYLCKNQKCSNHFMKKGAMGVKMSLESFNVNNLPQCTYCRKLMGSELELSIFYLKQELELPEQAVSTK